MFWELKHCFTTAAVLTVILAIMNCQANSDKEETLDIEKEAAICDLD